MDHAINALMPFYEIELEYVAEELSSGQYAKLSECPSYQSAKALLDAIRRMERYYYGEAKTMSIRDEMEWRQ
ncbi:hypothetical protein [Bacillus sp. JJ722]|uniref:hypothetical protein n=1 Tax=Bacillus sp. JJ722 TaxID=3122973 RepID=UPI002FFFDE3C